MTVNKFNIVFRVDASERIGTGHVMRCLSLAEELRSRNSGVLFIMRELAGNLCDYVEKMGYKTWRLPAVKELPDTDQASPQYADWLEARWETDAEQTAGTIKSAREGFDWLIIDHYSLDARWEKALRPHVQKIMVIDDLADRPHDCDLLLDQNYYRNGDERYTSLLPETCMKLFGPRYALLRREFSEVRRRVRERAGIVRRILILFGGIDKNNDTSMTVRAVLTLQRPDIAVDVVVGGSNLHKEEIGELCLNHPHVTCHYQSNSVAELMAAADLAIGAGGITTWERCCMGLPSFVLAAAENQIGPVAELEAGQVLQYLGESGSADEKNIAAVLNRFIGDPGMLRQYSKNAMDLVDGIGVSRCAEKLAKSENIICSRS